MNDENKGMLHIRKIRLDLLRNRIPQTIFETLNRMLESSEYDEFDNQLKLIKRHFPVLSDMDEIDEKIEDDREREKWGVRALLDENQKLINDRDWISEKAHNLDKENIKLKSLIEQTKEGLLKVSSQAHAAQTSEKEKNEEIKKLNSQITELRGKVQQNRIDEKIPGYVDGVKEKLDKDDDYFIKMSNRWAIAGGLSALGAIISAFITFFITVDFKDISSTELIYIFTRGLLGIALLSWLSYICFCNSKKYTHESIRRKDRQHALMFGKIFLQIYGSTATKEDAINVFKDWNMSGDSAFSDQTEQPPGIQSIISSIKDKIHPKDVMKE